MRGADAELLAAVLVDVLRDTAASRCAAARRADGRCMLRACATSAFLSGIAVRDQRAVRGDDEREAVLADPDAIDHPPHFLEAELADQPAGRLVEAGQVDGEDRGRQQSSSTPDWRHRRRRRSCVASSSGIETRGVPTRLDAIDLAALVEQRDLAELAELRARSS